MTIIIVFLATLIDPPPPYREAKENYKLLAQSSGKLVLT